jgi:predicted metal-dependent peptidase
MTSNAPVLPTSSNQSPAPTPGAGNQVFTPSETTTLKKAFEEITANDPRCKGLARYVASVRIFWSRQIPTACAGHGFIFFNPDFYDKIPEQTRITVMVHEIWHLILKHLERGKNCDPMSHNEAADHVINNGLEEDGFTFEGTTPCKDPQFKGQSTEQVYNTIWVKRQKDGKMPSPEVMENHVPAELIEDLIDAVCQAEGTTLEQQAQANEDALDSAGMSPGSVGGNLGRNITIHSQKVIATAPYEEIFAPYLTDPLSGGRRTYMRPNRRQHGAKSKLILPGRWKKKGPTNRLTHLGFAMDVSGSVTKKMETQMNNSLRTIKELLNPALMTVMFFDTRIVFEKTYTDKEAFSSLTVQAGGGTNLMDVYKRTAEFEPEALVIFTDLEVGIPKQPKWDTIWLVPDSTCSVPANLYGELYLIPPQ